MIPRYFDVSNAFTQADMDDVDLFVEPPEGFEEWEIIDGKRVSKLLHLRKALYGTKQASRLWQETLRSFLVDEFHFIPSKTDPCVFCFTRGNEKIIVGVYVDDIITAHKGDKLFAEFSRAFDLRFKSKCLGKLDWFLGMGITQHDDFSVSVDHSQSIGKLVEKFIPGNSVTREYPSPDVFNKLDFAQSDEERAKVILRSYPSIIGSLLYIELNYF